MKNKPEIAVSKFKEGFNCAQSVLYSQYEALNLNPEAALKIACGFGGGMGRNGEVCGAVSGGIMAISAKYGKTIGCDTQAMEITYQKTRELMEAFKNIHGTCICRELLNGCDLRTDDGHRAFKENNLKNTVCIPCVRTAVEILEKIL